MFDLSEADRLVYRLSQVVARDLCKQDERFAGYKRTGTNRFTLTFKYPQPLFWIFWVNNYRIVEIAVYVIKKTSNGYQVQCFVTEEGRKPVEKTYTAPDF